MTVIRTRPAAPRTVASGHTDRIPTNVFELEDAWQLELVAPGLSKDDFELQLEDGRLLIRAEREADPAEGAEVLRREFGSYVVEKSFKLSDKVDSEGITASYEAGVLTIRLPKAENAKPRKVSVQ